MGKRQSFATKKVLLEKSMKIHKQKSQNSATKVVPFCDFYLLFVEKLYLSFGKISKSHTRNRCLLSPLKPPPPKLNPLSSIFYIHRSLGGCPGTPPIYHICSNILIHIYSFYVWTVECGPGRLQKLFTRLNPSSVTNKVA